MVVSGAGQMLLDGEVVDLAPWDTVRVAPEVVRAFAAGPDGLEIIAVGGPKPEGGDGEQAPVEWPGRATASGERGIRTPGRVSPSHDFQSCPFSRSGTSPGAVTG